MGILLTSEPTASLRLDDHSLRVTEVQGSLQCPVDVVGALQGADDLDGSITFRNSDGSLGFDVQLLLETNPEGSLYHNLHILHFLQRLAFPDLDRAEDLRGLLDGVDGLGRVVLDADVACRLLDRVSISRRQQEDRLFLVPDFAPLRGQDRLVVPDELDDVVPGMSSAVTRTTRFQSNAGRA